MSRLHRIIFSLLAGILLLSLADPAFAQIPGPLFDQIPGARAMGMGRAFAAIADDPSAIRINPAGISQNKAITVGTAYQRNADELNEHTFAVVDSQTSQLAAGLSYSIVNDNALGFIGNDYKKTPPYSMLSLALADSGLESMRLGLAFHWLRTDNLPLAPRSLQTYELTAGVIVPFEQLWGLKVACVGRNLIGHHDWLLARQVDVTGVMTPFKFFRAVGSINLDVSNSRESDVGYGFGGEVEIVKQLRLRAGMRRDPSTRDTFVGGGIGFEGAEGGILYGYERNLTYDAAGHKQGNQHAVELFLRWL